LSSTNENEGLSRYPLPGVPTPVLNADIANKLYVDSSGGGANTFARVVKKVDQTVNNSTVLVNDNELFVALSVNKTYGFLLGLRHNSGTVPDLKYTFTVPAAASGALCPAWSGSTGANELVFSGVQVVQTSGNDGWIQTLGHVIMAGTAGNLQLQWAQNAANASDTDVLQGAYLIVWEELP